MAVQRETWFSFGFPAPASMLVRRVLDANFEQLVCAALWYSLRIVAIERSDSF